MINQHFRPIQIYIDRETDTAILLSPKVMTTFMRRFLCNGLRRFRGQENPSNGRYAFTPWARSFPLAPARDYAELLRRPERFTIYALVRNPYARLLSGWKNKLHDPHTYPKAGGVRYPRSMRGQELQRFRRFAGKTGMGGAEAGTLVPFDTFTACVAAQRTGWRNHHWDLQTLSLQSHRLPIDRPIRIEHDLPEGMDEIADRLGFDRHWASETVGQPWKSSGSDGHAAFTPSLINQAAQIYADDFAALPYAPDDLETYVRMAPGQ